MSELQPRSPQEEGSVQSSQTLAGEPRRTPSEAPLSQLNSLLSAEGDAADESAVRSAPTCSGSASDEDGDNVNGEETTTPSMATNKNDAKDVATSSDATAFPAPAQSSSANSFKAAASSLQSSNAPDVADTPQDNALASPSGTPAAKEPQSGKTQTGTAVTTPFSAPAQPATTAAPSSSSTQGIASACGSFAHNERASFSTQKGSAPASHVPSLTTSSAEAAIQRWKDNKDYLKLQREMSKLLSSLDRTPLADWAAQASLLSQLQRTVQTYKDVIGAVELPDGDRFARTLWRALSPQTVVGVQRKALEVLQSYLEFVNPAYPMVKDLPHFLPGLLELLPQATMQVKGDVLELLDGSVVRRMPPAALRACAQGLLSALLGCLEESETSPMYRRTMALLEYMHATLRCDDAVGTTGLPAPSTTIYAAELRGGQVLPAYTWLLIRDAASVRSPALNVMKTFIAQAGVPSSVGCSTRAGSDRSSDATDGAPSSPEPHVGAAALPDWVGGDVQAVVAALLNSLQDSHEKTHRLALDVLALVCPLSGAGSDGSYPHTAVGACRYECAVGITPAPSPTSASHPPPPQGQRCREGDAAACCSFTGVVAQSELFSFETKALLVAAAVQLLGTRHGTPSVTRRILQWLTVDPGFDGDDHGRHQDEQGANFISDYGAEAAADAAVPGSSPPSSNAYVQDITSFILAQGFHMVVQHWESTWTHRRGAGDAKADDAPLLARVVAASELSALQHSARASMHYGALRLSSASSIAAAMGGGGSAVEGVHSAAAAMPTPAASVLATPLVWLRALLFLFRYRSPSSAHSPTGFSGEGGGPVGSAATLEPLRLNASDGAGEPDVGFPFLLHLAPLVLPSLSRLLVDVPSVLARQSSSSSVGRYGVSSVSGVNGLPEEDVWAAEVRELLRVLPWTSFVKLDVVNARGVEKLIRPTLCVVSSTAGEESSIEPLARVSRASPLLPPSDLRHETSASGVEHLQRRVQHYIHEAFSLASAMEPALIDATADQPLAAQEYVRASLDWSDSTTHLLSDVLAALTVAVRTEEGLMSRALIPLLVSTANGLLRLLVQRLQQLMEPMLDAVLATATVTGTAVVGADFFSSFVSAVDTRVLRQLREATLQVTHAILLGGAERDQAVPPGVPTLIAMSDTYSAEVQNLLSRMHHTTLRFTSFLAQLHLRCQQQAVAGVLLDSASEDSAGTRERELARQTSTWLVCLCKACTAAGSAEGAPLFFARAVRLVLDMLLRARGSLLPEPLYNVLEASCSSSTSVAETDAFAETFVLAPVVRCLWEGCERMSDEATVQTSFATLDTVAPAGCPDPASMCCDSLLVLIAVSTACARCLDLCILKTSADVAVPRLVRLHRRLSDMRALLRCGHLVSSAVPESAALSELQDPGVLFLGSLAILDSLSQNSLDTLSRGGTALSPPKMRATAEATRQLARAYLSDALMQDLPSIVLPLFFSFLCPLVLPMSAALSPREAGLARGSGGAISLHRSPTPAFSALPLAVLLPTLKRSSGGATATVRQGGQSEAADGFSEGDSTRTYRHLEAPELVQHISALLQLPTSRAWVRQAMRTPTPNSLRVLLRGLEAQSFMAPEGRTGSSIATSPGAMSNTAPSHEGPSDTLFAATALLLLNLSRQSLLSMHWSHMRLRDQAGGGGRAHPSCSSLDSPPHPEAPTPPHPSLLLDSLACLNRLLELSQTGPRTQPHRTAVLTWQFTSAQFLPLLRLAVQANLHVAQAMLLEHLRGVVLYLDDVTDAALAVSPSLADPAYVGVAGSLGEGGRGVASRHWHPHALLRVGVAAAGLTDNLFAGSAPVDAASISTAAGGVGKTDVSWSGDTHMTGLEQSSTPVMDDLKRTPPAVLSNKLLYAMIGEVVEHVLGVACETRRDAMMGNVASGEREVDTLVVWLRFYCDVMPYLYRDLVASVEVVADALLSALEATSSLRIASSLPVSEAPSSASSRIRCVCYAALTYMVRFLFSVARAADVENYETAVKTKESMSWIASTFTQDDPVAQARSSTMWTRSSVLAPVRACLGRLVSASVPCLRVRSPIHIPVSSFPVSEGHCFWGYDMEDAEEVAMGWKARALASRPSSVRSAESLPAHARRLLTLLSHSAGPQFLTAFIEHWCAVHAAPSSSSLWMFETAPQRQCRLRQMKKSRDPQFAGGQRAAGAVCEGPCQAEDALTRWSAWEAREEAQQAACVLLEEVGVSLVEVTTALAPLLRSAIATQQRADQQQLKADAAAASAIGNGDAPATPCACPPPARVTQMLYFLDQLVEGVCVRRQGGLWEGEAETILALAAEVVSQWPPDALSFCCLLHTLYCVVAYARDEGVAAAGDKGNSCSHNNGARSSAPLANAPVTALKVYQSKDYTFTLCRLLEGLVLSPAAAHRNAALMLLQLLCQSFYAVLPSSLGWMDNPGRLVDAATRVFQRTLLPALRRGIASVSEAEILSSAPLVNASLRVLRATISGFAPDLTFEKRVQRDIVGLFFTEHFFRYSRSALHEWTLLLRQVCAIDHDFHTLLCERIVPSPGRFSSLMMSRETEALLRERALKSLAFYTYAVMAAEEPSAVTATAAAAWAGPGPGPAVSAIRHKELIYLIREHLTHTLQHFSPAATVTAAEIERKEVFVQPLRAAFLVFRVLLLCGARESLVASLWPLVWPELLRALAFTPYAAGKGGAGTESLHVSTDTLQEILSLQLEALKVLDVDYTLYPAHALAFRWLFTDDAALTGVLALQQQQRHLRSRTIKKGIPHSPSPLSMLLRASVVRRVPLVSHLEVLHLLTTSLPVSPDTHLLPSAVVGAVHEPRQDNWQGDGSDGCAPLLSTIQRCWPIWTRPSAADRGLRRPLYNIPYTHYPRLDGVHRAAQAFTMLLQRVNGDAFSCGAASPDMRSAECLRLLQAEVGQCVGYHNEVDVPFMRDLVEADLTTTDPDTML